MFTQAMKYAEIIKGLRIRSGLGVKDYAEHVGMSVAHISNVVNGAQPGSLKMLRDCLRADGKDIEDCLGLPPDSITHEYERKILDLIHLITDEQKASLQNLLLAFVGKRTKRPHKAG